MAQVVFENSNYYGELSFMIETKFDGSYERNIKFSTFDEMNYYLMRYYSNKYSEMFDDEDIFQVYFIGITFKGIQDSERFSVNITEGWKHATLMFDESKFGDLNIDKLKRIKEILAE